MKVLCWNINGLKRTLLNINLRHGSLSNFFDAHSADVICLQETKLTHAAVEKAFACPPGFESFWTCSTGKLGYSGCATFVRIPQYEAVAAEADDGLSDDPELRSEGRFLLVDLGALVVINIYAPNAGDRSANRPRLAFKLRWLAALRAKLDALTAAGRDVLVVGDFNISAERRDVSPALQWDGMYSREELDFMADLFSRYRDVWRARHPAAAGVYTVWSERTSARVQNVGQRIDYAVCGPALLPRVSACEILLDLPVKWSDHAPLAVAVDGVPAHPWGRPSRPCALSSSRDPRFHDRSQRSLRAMFGGAAAARPGRGPPPGAENAAATPATANGLAATRSTPRGAAASSHDPASCSRAGLPCLAAESASAEPRSAGVQSAASQDDATAQNAAQIPSTEPPDDVTRSLLGTALASEGAGSGGPGANAGTPPPLLTGSDVVRASATGADIATVAGGEAASVPAASPCVAGATTDAICKGGRASAPDHRARADAGGATAGPGGGSGSSAPSGEAPQRPVDASCWGASREHALRQTGARTAGETGGNSKAGPALERQQSKAGPGRGKRRSAGRSGAPAAKRAQPSITAFMRAAPK